MYPIRHDLPESTREQAVRLLNARLADAIDLMLQSKHAHWNVKGKVFIALHELFDEVYETVAEQVDLLAERAAQLGGRVEGTVRASARSSTLADYPVHADSGPAHVEALSMALESFAASVRRDIDAMTAVGDADTADIFTEISRATDKHLWLVSSHLHGV